MKKRHEEEQIIRILREAEAKAMPIREVCKQHNNARRLKELEAENAKLKQMVADQMLVIDELKEFSQKNDDPVGAACGAGAASDSSGDVATQSLSLPGAERARGRSQFEAA